MAHKFMAKWEWGGGLAEKGEGRKKYKLVVTKQSWGYNQ